MAQLSRCGKLWRQRLNPFETKFSAFAKPAGGTLNVEGNAGHATKSKEKKWEEARKCSRARMIAPLTGIVRRSWRSCWRALGHEKKSQQLLNGFVMQTWMFCRTSFNYDKTPGDAPGDLGTTTTTLVLPPPAGIFASTRGRVRSHSANLLFREKCVPAAFRFAANFMAGHPFVSFPRRLAHIGFRRHAFSPRSVSSVFTRLRIGPVCLRVGIAAVHDRKSGALPLAEQGASSERFLARLLSPFHFSRRRLFRNSSSPAAGMFEIVFLFFPVFYSLPL